MDNKIEVLVKKSLEFFDKQNDRNKDAITYIDNKKETPFQSSIPTEEMNTSSINHEISIVVNDIETRYEFEQLAIYDIETKTWVWSWCIPIIINNLTKESKFLLDYGLSLNPTKDTEDFYYLKVLLTNSRIHISDELQLNIILGICSYILKNRIQFIYGENHNRKNKDNVIIFYLIK